MKSFQQVIITFCFIMMSAFFSCSDNSTQPPIDSVETDYFPVKQGSLYNYEMTIIDSLGIITSGSRTISYGGNKTQNSNVYQVFTDRFDFNAFSFSDTALVRKTSEKVYYYTDNSQAMILIPDSLRSSVQVDSEAKMLSFPLSGSNWQVYNLGINFGFFVFNVVNVNASTAGKENLSLVVNGSNLNIEAIKVKYNMSVSLDVNTIPIVYNAEAWFADKIGLVKLEGDSEAINFMVGNNMFLPGGTIKLNLKQYQIP